MSEQLAIEPMRVMKQALAAIMADRHWHLKFALGGAIMLVLVVVFDIGSSFTSPKDRGFDERWAEMASRDGKRLVPTLKIEPFYTPPPVTTAAKGDAPPKLARHEIVPPVPVRIESEPSRVEPPKRETPPKVRRQQNAGNDICARHKLQKIVTRGGKSWRCSKRAA